MKTIVIVGLSDNPNRPSYQVGLYLKNQGYKIIPVNPNIKEVFGIKSFASVSEITESTTIDIVDVFRKPEEAVEVIKEVIKIGRKPTIWLQEGVGSPEAKKLAEENGLEIVMDMCIMKAYKNDEVKP